MKARLAVVAVLVVALLAGWLWGASGRWALERALTTAELHADVLEAHASILGARASLCNADVGGTSAHLENARRFIGRAATRIGDPRLNDESLRRQLAGFGARIDRAQRLAVRLARSADGAPPVHGPASPAKSRERP